MKYEWEIVYLDDEKLALRINHGTRRLIPMIIFDSADMFEWKKGDLIAIESKPDGHREIEKATGISLSEDDYILHNQRTQGKATIRKNDYEHEDAWKWLRELQERNVV